MIMRVDDDANGVVDFSEFRLLWKIFLRDLRQQDRVVGVRRKSSSVWISADQLRRILEVCREAPGGPGDRVLTPLASM